MVTAPQPCLVSPATALASSETIHSHSQPQTASRLRLLKTLPSPLFGHHSSPASITLGETLPAWLSFLDNANGTATVIGIPDPGGPSSYSLTVTATNGIAPDAMQSFTLFVNNPPPAITSADNTAFVVGAFGSFTI